MPGTIPKVLKTYQRIKQTKSYWGDRALLSKVVKVVFDKIARFEQKLEGSERISFMSILEKRIPKGESKQYTVLRDLLNPSKNRTEVDMVKW